MNRSFIERLAWSYAQCVGFVGKNQGKMERVLCAALGGALAHASSSDPSRSP